MDAWWIDHEDHWTLGFEEIVYTKARIHFQKLTADGVGSPSDLRLARHCEEIMRFQKIITLSHSEGRLNTSISNEVRARFGLKKRTLRVLDPDRPAPTITSMPDDLLNYSEPRTLTVREWGKLCRSIPLASVSPDLQKLWLELKPVRALAEQFRIEPAGVKLDIEVEVETRILQNETTLECPLPDQLEIAPIAEHDGINIAIPIELPLIDVSKLLDAHSQARPS
jgi:Domain of unknown function (DUF4403)